MKKLTDKPWRHPAMKGLVYWEQLRFLKMSLGRLAEVVEESRGRIKIAKDGGAPPEYMRRFRRELVQRTAILAARRSGELVGKGDVKEVADARQE